jgi:predicted dehydrogenase
MTTKNEMKRRNFIRNSVGSAAALTALQGFTPASVLGANDKIRMGIIGSGGRGRGVMRTFMRSDIPFIAVCDAYKPNLDEGMRFAGENATAYTDYRKLLENKDVDAVLIGTPEHQHGVQLIDSVNAGKDVYCEKPMSHSIEEGNRMIKAVRQTDRIVQIGMQRRSTPSVIEAKTVIDEGKLGNIFMVKAQWNWNYSNPMNYGPLDGELDWDAFCYPAKKSEFHVNKFRNWRVFWDFSGGHVCDQGTHLMDVIQWFMGSGTPKMAECFGRVFKMTGAETPDVFSAIFEYEKFNASWELCYTTRYENDWKIAFLGDQGSLVLSNLGSRFFAGPGHNHDAWDPCTKPDWESQGGLSDTHHVVNFIECMRSRKEPNAPVEVGHTGVCGPHLANIAWKNQKRAYLNKDATKATV